MPDIQIKICGITNEADAEAAVEAGADYLGIIFHPPSPRFVSLEIARRIVVAARGVPVAGVFVNASPGAVAAAVSYCGLGVAQRHGDEAGGGYDRVGARLWRAVKYESGRWKPDPARWPAERYVVDAAVAGMYGGTGSLADWTEAAEIAARLPVMLAGGLTPGNVTRALGAVRPLLGVDVSGGVESAPGRKDREKMFDFVHAVREWAKSDRS